MQKTSIEWTDYSSNPIYAVDLETGKRGWHCNYASRGCHHCYAEAINKRFGTGLPYAVSSNKRIEFRVNEKEFESWQKLKRPSRIFIGDMLDLFLPEISRDLLLRVFMAVRACPQHTFQVLTKRPEQMKLFFETWFPPAEALADMSLQIKSTPGNVWLGVSCEDQKTANERIPLLMLTPATVRWVSAEPMISQLDLKRWLPRHPFYLAKCQECAYVGTSEEWRVIPYFDDADIECPNCESGKEEEAPGLDWLVCGAESGPNARPMEEEWVQCIRDQCQTAGVAFFYKQAVANGKKIPLPMLDGRQWMEFPGERRERGQMELREGEWLEE